MSSKSYRDGAKALMGLKKKDDGDAVDDHDDQHREDKDGDNNVEAAVMRYVAGTLGTPSPSSLSKQAGKRKKSFTNEELNEFQHWNSFLITDQQGDENQGSTQQETGRSKKKRKHKQDVGATSLQVDPELSNLDDATDHEQLVRAAILDANQLAEDVNIHDYIQHPQDDATALDTNIMQAAQAAAAAVAAQEEETQKQEELRLQQGSQKPRRRSSTNKGHKKKPVTTEKAEASSLPEASVSEERGMINQVEAETLMAKAVDKASNNLQQTSHGKTFSDEEIDAIDAFIKEYCMIKGMSKEDICQRVWSNGRCRDDFWDLVHRVLPYRTRASVYKHVRRSYHVFEVRGKWTPQEDELLAKYVGERESQWTLIGGLMGRMPEDCRDRWRNYGKCGKQRAQNKWTLEEESLLKDIVHAMLSLQTDVDNPTINWTVVSEKMGGARSRIQCRYKWNKLLKRDATARADNINLDDKIWMLNKLQELCYNSENTVNWDTLASFQLKSHWSADDLKLCFHRMKSTLKGHKKMTTLEICQDLLQGIVDTTTEGHGELPVVFYRSGKPHLSENGQPPASAIPGASPQDNESEDDHHGQQKTREQLQSQNSTQPENVYMWRS